METLITIPRIELARLLNEVVVPSDLNTSLSNVELGNLARVELKKLQGRNADLMQRFNALNIRLQQMVTHIDDQNIELKKLRAENVELKKHRKRKH